VSTHSFSWNDVVPRDWNVAEIIRAGVDRVELAKFQHSVDVAGQALFARTFTQQEIAFCAGRVHCLATRFAAKEAAAKVLGTGFRGLGWREIEVLTSPDGEPRLVLHGRAGDRARNLGITSIGLSLTHTSVAAEAFVVALCRVPAAEQHIHQETNLH